MLYFLQGLTMGFAYVAPIGMQNIFVISSASSDKLPRALLTALIVIFFDVSLALACFFGIGAVIERYSLMKLLITIAGSIVVMVIGVRLILSKPVNIEKSEVPCSIPSTIASACIVTWFNPQAIIDGSMMLGAFHASLGASDALPFITGVALASCLWFSTLSVAVSLFSHLFTVRVLRWLNIICGSILVLYALKLFTSIF
ncbi:MAG: LysE family transporter [Spirochaetes bacterium]|uniref:LysE family transporter n=1 Tax=Candidatus Ornithospirochaeta stercoripullorum TaxID=2840899 RepID=A0A9D9E240_9SPIO|nr:LysE family transporter [Candidatus Ornithospirochaeta stercoripullorum]